MNILVLMMNEFPDSNVAKKLARKCIDHLPQTIFFISVRAVDHASFAVISLKFRARAAELRRKCNGFATRVVRM